MRLLPLPLVLAGSLALPLAAHAAPGKYATEFHQAKKLEATDRAAAAEGMIRSYQLAVAAGNADYATAAGVNACHMLYAQGKAIDAAKLAREVILALDPLENHGSPNNDALRRVQLFGLMERGLLAEGRLGAAWKANRAAAETLRAKKVSADADGPSIDVEEAVHLQGMLRSQGWRIIERESELLDLAGRSNEALELLSQATTFIEDVWDEQEELIPEERFYAFKLLAARGMILDFLGYEEETIVLQRRLLEMSEGYPNIAETSRGNVRLNLLRNLSQWNGPSEEMLKEARTIGEQLKSSGSGRGVDRLLAKMELDLRNSNEVLEMLRAEGRTNAQLGYLFDAVYADRDALAERSKQGEAGLDGEFISLLRKVRSQGNKRAEPSLYREYGDYLLAQKRPAEAVAMFIESLRITRSFGWTLHEPALLTSLFKARFSSGDVAGARATLAELETFLNDHPDLPAARRVAAETGRAIAYGLLGQRDAALAALNLAREHGKNLPDYKKRWLTPEAERDILNPAPARETVPALPVAITQPLLAVHPLSVTSMVPPAKAARSRFSIFNTGASRITGHWRAEGPGATVSAGVLVFDASKPVATVKVPASVGAGELASITGRIVGASTGSMQAAVVWENASEAAGAPATWTVKWDKASTDSVVMDASLLEANPFHSISLFHELSVPLGDEQGIPFRLRSPLPLRVEYYDSSSSELVAIDANGNGDFTEAGDLYLRGPSGIAAAIFPAPLDGGDRTVQIRISNLDGDPIGPSSDTLVLEAEVYRDGRWVKEAEDLLK